MLHNDKGWMKARTLPGIAGLLDAQGLIGTRQGTYDYNMKKKKKKKKKDIETHKMSR